MTSKDVRDFIIRRCNERIQASQYGVSHKDEYEKARLLKYQLGNIVSPTLICRFFVERHEDIKSVIIVAKPYTKQWRAYSNKMIDMEKMREYAERFVATKGMSKDIDVMVMRSARVIS